MENNGSQLRSPRRGRKRMFSAHNGPGGFSNKNNTNNSNNNNGVCTNKRRKTQYADVGTRSSPRNKRAVNDIENSRPRIEHKQCDKAMTLSKYHDTPFILHSTSSSPSSSPSSSLNSSSLSSSPPSPVSPDAPLPPLNGHVRSLQGSFLGAKGKSRMTKRTTYKHVPHSEKPAHLVAKRNARERRRVQAVNSAFSRLRKHVPYEPRHKRLSKVKTLRFAIDYIQHLQDLIKQHDQQLLSRRPSCGRQETNDLRPIFPRHELPIGDASHPRLGAATGVGSGRFSSCASKDVETRVRRSGVDSRRRRFLHSEGNFLDKPADHFQSSFLESPLQGKRPAPHFPSCSSSLALTPTTPRNQAHPDMTSLVQETRVQVMTSGLNQVPEHSSAQPGFLGRAPHLAPPDVPSIAASAPDIPPCPSITRGGSQVFPPTGSPHLPPQENTLSNPPYPSFLDCASTAPTSGSTPSNGVVAMTTRSSSIPADIAQTMFSEDGRVEPIGGNPFGLFDQAYLPYTESYCPVRLDHEGNLGEASLQHSHLQPGQNSANFSSLPLGTDIRLAPSCAELTISTVADHMTMIQPAETFAGSKVDSHGHCTKVQCDYGWTT